MNYENSQNLCVFILDKNIDKTTLKDIFDVDSDFMENKEYFREDTLSLGYASESERCAEEIFEACKEIKEPLKKLQAMIDMMPEYSNGEQSFMIGNSNHSGDYQFDLREVGDKFVVALAWIG